MSPKMRLSAIAVTFHAIDSIQYVSAMDPIIDLGYVKYKGIFNATSRFVEHKLYSPFGILC